MSLDEQRIRTLENRVLALEKHIETELRRVKSEMDESVDDKIAAQTRHFEGVVRLELGSIRSDLETIKGGMTVQTKYLEEAAEERGRRKQREDDLAFRGKQASVHSIEAKGDAEVERYRSETRVARWRGIAIAIATVIAASAGIVGYVYGTHH